MIRRYEAPKPESTPEKKKTKPTGDTKSLLKQRCRRDLERISNAIGGMQNVCKTA